MNETQPIRIGIVGAGANTRAQHLPGFAAIEGVEIRGVVNSSPESTHRVAQEYDIPTTYAHWQALIDDTEIDAVMIGTWPNLHCEITCAALESGKHVLTEARMARDAVEAERMFRASRQRPELITQIVPSPFGLVEDAYVRKLLADGFLGELRELVVIGATDSFWDESQPLHWRQDRAISGNNVMAMGILHETAMRWTPPTTHVFAQAEIFAPKEHGPAGSESGRATVPDSLQIVTVLEGGARGLYHLSAIDLCGPGHQIHLYGSRGTIKYAHNECGQLRIGGAGDTDAREVEVPAELRGGWRVEAEFIEAIRGSGEIRFTRFEDGVRYMQFTDAVAESAERHQQVRLPDPVG